MTCIVGIQKGRTVWIGADSAMTRGLDQRLTGEKKVFINGEFIMGVAGYPRTMSLLNHSFDPPAQPDDMADDEFIHTVFVDAVKNSVLLPGETGFDSNVMIGYRGKLYMMESNFQILVPAPGFEAMGSGGEIAIGVLRATRGMRNPRKRCLLALEASAENNAGVRPPFHVLKLRKGSKGQ